MRRTPEEPLFNYLLAQYHPLGCTRPAGEHLKYIVYAAGRPITCLAWSSAPRHLGARDRYIGWSAQARRRNINPRFLIVPRVQVKHLASHILGEMARRTSIDWEHIYGHPICFLETSVDPERYRGTCYRAASQADHHDRSFVRSSAGAQWSALWSENEDGDSHKQSETAALSKAIAITQAHRKLAPLLHRSLPSKRIALRVKLFGSTSGNARTLSWPPLFQLLPLRGSYVPLSWGGVALLPHFFKMMMSSMLRVYCCWLPMQTVVPLA